MPDPSIGEFAAEYDEPLFPTDWSQCPECFGQVEHVALMPITRDVTGWLTDPDTGEVTLYLNADPDVQPPEDTFYRCTICRATIPLLGAFDFDLQQQPDGLSDVRPEVPEEDQPA